MENLEARDGNVDLRQGGAKTNMHASKFVTRKARRDKMDGKSLAKPDLSQAGIYT
jgi:hypothetical protein